MTKNIVIQKNKYLKYGIHLPNMKFLFVYAFIVIRHVLSKCFACLLFEEAHEMARIREIEIIRHFTDSAGWRIAIHSSVLLSRRCFIKWVADTPNWAFTELLSVMRLT